MSINLSSFYTNSKKDDNDDTLPILPIAKVELHRNLKARHMTMIAIGGTIGTGLFLASGQALAASGPAGVLVSYLMVSVMVYFVMTSLGELATHLPISGSFNTYGSRFVDEAFGFALAYNYFFSWVVTLAGELVAAGILIQFWLPHLPTVLWSLAGMVIMFLLNAFTVKGYGEAEYWFALIKVVAVVIFVVIGCVVDAGALGHHKYAFENWKIPGAPFVNGFSGVVTTFIISGFSFQGTELVGIAAGESNNPKKDMPRAMNQIIWRIVLFYVATIFVMGLIIPYNDPNLAHIDGVGNISVSPFTLVFVRAGLGPSVHVMNGVILCTILSAGNSGLYACTRIFWTLAMEGKAPAFFRRLTPGGIPFRCLVLTCLLASVFFGLSYIGNQVVYQWLVNLSGVMGFIAWFGISLSHWRFRKAYIAQGFLLDDLVYKAMFYPFGPIFASFLVFVAVFGQGYTAFITHPFNITGFISAYISIPVFLIVFGVYKFVKKTRIIPLMEIDLMTGSVREKENLERLTNMMNGNDDTTIPRY